MRILVILLFVFCSIGNTSAQTDTRPVVPEDVLILPENAPLPSSVEQKGRVEIRNGWFKEQHGYEEVMQMTKEKAAALGGNIVKITKFYSSSEGYGVFADVYLSPDRSAIWEMERMVIDSIEKEMPRFSSYGLLYLYRSKYSGSSFPFKISINGKKLGKLKNNSGQMLKIYSTGLVHVGYGVLRKDIYVKPGRAYFIRFQHLSKGFSPSTEITEVSKETGYWEYIETDNRQ
jgi:hypothetical protein